MVIELASVGKQDMFRPRIIVVGVGGGGCNAVNNMIESNLQGIEFLAANTDAQSLQASKAQRKLQLGNESTAGLGSGARPDVGRRAAQESAQDIRDALEGCNMLFIAAGMGGGTGTGAAPVFAEIAESMGILTIAVVTKPFEFEGAKRMQAASDGLLELQKFVGTLIIIPNQNLFRIANERTTFAEAFKMADEVLCSGVRSITDLIIIDGLVNLDFADIRTVMNEMGKAMMGTGEAEGEERALRAAEAAITNPLLEDSNLRGAKEVMVNITAGKDVGLHEIDEAIGRIRREAGEEAYVHFGAALDETMHGIMRISVVATGIEGGGQQNLALEGHRSEQVSEPVHESVSELVIESGGETLKTPASAVESHTEMPSEMPISPEATHNAAANNHDMVGDAQETAAKHESASPVNDDMGDMGDMPGGDNADDEISALSATRDTQTETGDRQNRIAETLPNALQWGVSGGFSGGSVVDLMASKTSPETPATPEMPESGAQATESTAPPDNDDDSENTANIDEDDAAFIPPAAHKIADEPVEVPVMAQNSSQDGLPTSQIMAGAALQATGAGERTANIDEDDAESDVAPGSESGSESGGESGGGSIFARWRNNRAAVAEKREEEAQVVESGETPQAQPSSESSPESSPEASPEVSPESSQPSANNSDEEVVIFRERRFLPEDDAVSDEMRAVAEEDEEEEESNLLRIPAFLRR